MLRRFSCFLSFVFLSLLLAYAPEILTSVSAPYSLVVPRRTLLCASVCIKEIKAQDAVCTLLRRFAKSHPGMHLRVRCLPIDDVDSAALSSDVLFCDMEEIPPEIPLYSLPDSDDRFVCLNILDSSIAFSVCAHTLQKDSALALLSYFVEESSRISSCTPSSYGVQ